jgi:transcriptional regulator with XRE-family HTH domain
MSPGQRIREKRKERNLSQAGLARLAGISRRHLAEIEKDDVRNVSVVVLLRIAGALGLRHFEFANGIVMQSADDSKMLEELTRHAENAEEEIRSMRVLLHSVVTPPAADKREVQKSHRARAVESLLHDFGQLTPDLQRAFMDVAARNSTRPAEDETSGAVVLASRRKTAASRKRIRKAQ